MTGPSNGTNTNEDKRLDDVLELMEFLTEHLLTPEIEATHGTFPATSIKNRAEAFEKTIADCSNNRLQVLKEETKTLANDKKPYELVLFLCATLEFGMRNTIYCGLNRFLHCNDKVLKEHLPKFRVNLYNFPAVMRDIMDGSDKMLETGHGSARIGDYLFSKFQNLLCLQKNKQFEPQGQMSKSSNLAGDLHRAYLTRNEIIHGNQVGGKQTKVWARMSTATPPQCYRAASAIWTVIEEFDQIVEEHLCSALGSTFTPFRPNMRGKKKLGDPMSEHQTKLVLQGLKLIK